MWTYIKIEVEKADALRRILLGLLEPNLDLVRFSRVLVAPLQFRVSGAQKPLGLGVNMSEACSIKGSKPIRPHLVKELGQVALGLVFQCALKVDRFHNSLVVITAHVLGM